MLNLEHGKPYKSYSLGQQNWYLKRSDGLIKAYYKTNVGKCGVVLYDVDFHGAVKCYMTGEIGGKKIWLG